MKKNKLALILIGVLLATNSFSQYKIKVKIKGAENQELILGYHVNDNLIPYDTITADKNGAGTFKGKKTLVGGMYFIFLPTKNYFDFLLGDDQDFYIENDTTDLLKKVKFTGSPDNEIFSAYHLFLISQNEKMAKLKEDKKKTEDKAKKAEIQKQIDATASEYQTYYDNILTENPDLFVTTFLKATRDVQIPQTVTGRQAQYYYYRNHFFDNFDVGDPRLYRTPLYENKIDMFTDKILVQHPDTLTKEIDIMLDKTRPDSLLFKYMLIHQFNKYAKSKYMSAENVYVHLGYIYIEEAYWSPDSFKNQLKPKLDRKSNCLVGNPAKPLAMQTLPQDSIGIENMRPFLENMKEQGIELEKEVPVFDDRKTELSQIVIEFMGDFYGYQNLYDIEAKYTIIWFYEPDCSHCKRETPLLYKKFIDELQEMNVAVVCYYMERNIDEWAKFSNHIGTWFNFVEKNKMYNWYNVWNPVANYRYKYDLSSSPVLYLLDEDKTIIAKRIGYEQAAEMIKAIEKEKNKE